jgi:hypothetical protein
LYFAFARPWWMKYFDSRQHLCERNLLQRKKSGEKVLELRSGWASEWVGEWRANESKSVHITFTTRRETFPPVHINSVHLPQQGDVKYLALYLDTKLTWRKHIFTKRKQLGLTLTKMMDYLAGSQNSPQTTFSYTKQSSHHSEPIEYNCAVWLPLQT